MFPLETNILIVDDSQSIRNIICDILSSMGYKKITEAEDVPTAQEIMSVAQKSGGKFDLILSDLNMPGPSGLDFLKYVRSSDYFKATPFLLITTESEKTSVLEAALLGVSGYVVKPFSYKTLNDRLRESWAKVSSDKAA